MVVGFSALGQILDDPHRVGKRREICRRLTDNPASGVAAADAAHRTVAIHVVQGREKGRDDRPVASRRVGDHRPDDQV